MPAAAMIALTALGNPLNRAHEYELEAQNCW
jgi:hypothetical protein